MVCALGRVSRGKQVQSDGLKKYQFQRPLWWETTRPVTRRGKCCVVILPWTHHLWEESLGAGALCYRQLGLLPNNPSMEKCTTQPNKLKCFFEDKRHDVLFDVKCVTLWFPALITRRTKIQTLFQSYCAALRIYDRLFSVLVTVTVGPYISL